MRRILIALGVSCWSLSGALAAEETSHDLTKPCPTAGFPKGRNLCNALEAMVVNGYSVDKPSCGGSCSLVAGAARVDITPPPGFPMGGNGFPAQIGRGYWTRLYARAFFFRDRTGQSLALVSCDLGAMSGGLQARVGEILNQKRRDLGLSPDNLVLSATHVHQGPGNFMSFKLYNDMGSRAQGFDHALFEELAKRIANAVLEAADKAKSAAENNQTELVLREGRVHDLLRNRAAEAFMLNRDRAAVLAAGPSSACPPPKACCAPDPYWKQCPRYRGVDDRIAVLEIRRTPKSGGQSWPAGSLVFLSVHPEAMSHDTQLHQSDFTGLAMSLLEKEWRAKPAPGDYVAAFFNGADGDISVRWKRQNRLETVAFASTLVGVIAALPDTVHVDSEATFRVARSELSSNCYLGFWPTELNSYPPACYDSRGDGRRICIAGKPLYGVATLGGAEDSRSPLFDLGWKTGVRTTPRELQGVKQGALESSFIPDPFHPGRHLDLTPLIAPACYYPETMPLSFIQIESPSGTLAFAALPGELTRTAWWRVEQKLAKPYRVIPIGLANEYVGYVTTREEYAAQAYEGASTIFGPFSAELIQANLVDLSGALHPPIDEAHKIVQKRTFYPEAIRRRSTFGPDSKFMPTGHGFPDDGLENLILDDDGLPDRHWPRFAWHENVTEISDWNGGERFIEVLREGELAQATDDDAGPNLLTVAINPSDLTEETSQSEFERASRAPTVAEAADRKKKKRRRWTAIWLAPQSIAEDDSFYFRVTLKDAQRTRCSRLFTLKEVRGWDPPHRVMAGDCPQ